jgi:type IV pilus assembly protein PilW
MNNRKQTGFSLVELMVALTLGLILLTGVVSIFLSSKVTYLANEKTARLQESGRVALDLITHDVRSAGYLGCAKIPRWFQTTLNTPTAALWNYFMPMMGYEADGSGNYAPALDVALNPAPVNDSDVIVTRGLLRDGRALTIQADMASASADPAVLHTTTAPVTAGQIYVLTDCESTTVFQATAYTAGAPNGTIAHATGGSSPGNSTTDLGYQYRRLSRLIPVQTYTYYVGNDPVTNEPGLYRKTGNAANSELLIEGIQALQIAYAIDNVGSDRVADTYVSANNVTDWNNVISVTLSLLARSEDSGADLDVQTYQILPAALGGKQIAPADDGRQRMLFNTTIAVRNRAL